jgi:hypothetical protein
MTWEEIRAHMISDFDATPLEETDSVGIVADGRLLTISRIRWGSSRIVELVEFTLLVTTADRIDAREALVRNGEMALGGFVERAGAIWWRHVAPIETLDVMEVQLPLAIAHGMASQAESYGDESLVTHQNTGLMWH